MTLPSRLRTQVHVRPVRAVLRAAWLVFTLVALVLHAPAAMDSAEAGPGPVVAAGSHVVAAVHHDGLPGGCHHGGYHAHSLCAPPAVLCASFEAAGPATGAPYPPVRGRFPSGWASLRSPPPPKSFA